MSHALERGAVEASLEGMGYAIGARSEEVTIFWYGTQDQFFAIGFGPDGRGDWDDLRRQFEYHGVDVDVFGAHYEAL